MFIRGKEVETLLKSGIPLEYAVNKLLEKFGCFVEPDFTFFRGEKEFSVDTSAHLIYNAPKKKRISFWLDLLIECKYNSPGHKWIFFSFGRTGTREVDKRESIILPFREQSGYIRKKPNPINKFLKDFIKETPVAWKGTDLFKKESYPKTIKEGLYQLKFSFIKKLMGQVSFRYPVQVIPNREFLIIPILLTNNPLYIFRGKLSLENIEKGEKLHLQRVKWLMLYSTLDSENKNHNTNFFIKEFKRIQEFAKKISGIFAEKEEDFQKQVAWFQKNSLPAIYEKVKFYPKIIWVIQHKHLESFLKNLYKELKIPKSFIKK